MITFRASAQFDQSATLIFVSEDQCVSKKFNFVNSTVKQSILNLIENNQFSGNVSEVFPVAYGNKLILFCGVGLEKELTLTGLRIITRNILQSFFLKQIDQFELLAHKQGEDFATAIMEGVLIGTYKWDKYISSEKPKAKKKHILIAQSSKNLQNKVVVAEATNFARDLVNENADVTTSVFLHKVIKDIIKGKKNVSTEILNKKQLQTKGLHLHLAVNQGSENEPKLIIVKYNGASKSQKYEAIVGKGMTYDTGGLNLKPTGGIESMKLDMAGAAAVIGTLKSAIDLKLKKNVLFVCAIAENTIDAKAYKPGEVITGYAKKSVEIGNTDAEGRLVLADAISYIVKNYKPSRIVDIATLTGACIVALANDHTGLVSNDNTFAEQLLKSAAKTDDRAWRLPSYPELADSVKSQIADIKNLGFPKGAGGSITAAEFLRQFTNGTAWAHLDIAGTSFVMESNRWYYAHGATGAGVRLLTDYLQNN